MSLVDAAISRVTLGRRVVLRDLHLRVEPGEIVALIGPNGAGKTTLMRAIAGLIPAEGRLAIAGHETAGLDARARARAVAYLAQNGDIAWPLPVRDIVALGRMPHGAGPDALAPTDRDIVEAAIRDCCIDHLADRPATELSGGERARVLLARALAVEAPLLLADEPVAALDPALQVAVLEILRQRAGQGRAVVVVMHDLGLACRIATRFVALQAGRIVADGPPAELMDSGALSQVFGIGFARARAGGIEFIAPVARPVSGLGESTADPRDRSEKPA